MGGDQRDPALCGGELAVDEVEVLDLGRLRDPVWVEQVVAFALAAAR